MIGIDDLVVAAFISLALFAPGYWAMRRLGLPLWTCIAGGFSSTTATLLLTALIAAPTGVSTVWLTAIALLCIGGLCHFGCRKSECATVSFARNEIDGAWPFLVSLVAALLSFAIVYGSITLGPQGETIRGWYRADFFKHLGHINALVNFGMPPRDIFGGGRPLEYYWLYYIIPALGAELYGTPASALGGAIVVQTFLFWFLVYGLFREGGAKPIAAALFALLAWLSLTMEGLATLIQAHFNWQVATEELTVGGMFGQLMGGSTLFRLNYVIPQHQLAMAGLLSWYLLYGGRNAKPGPALTLLAHAPLAAIGAISTLFGAVCLCVYGITQMLDQALPLKRRIAQIAAVGVAAVTVALALGVVHITSEHSALASPLFTDPPNGQDYVSRLGSSMVALVPLFSVLILPSTVVILRWFRERDQLNQMPVFVGALVAVGLIVMIGTNVFLENRRLGNEIQIRSSLLVGLGLMLGFAQAWLNARKYFGSLHLPAICLGAALVLGLATPIIDATWHLRSSGGWKATIATDDLRILDYIRSHTPIDSVILQYPEPPVMAGGGRDTWVAIFGARMLPASLRATDWPKAAPIWKAMQEFYAGKRTDVPKGTGYIYLSRALHPQSYDLLIARLAADSHWTRSACYADACLFSRAATK